ncbi:MAG: carboxypeptidase-like regulatory domain-containing protein, partial [Bacteroidota bacterium]
MRTIIFITFILSSWTACAQSSLKGQVKSKAGEEIFAANVYLKNNLQKGTQTDFNGKFELSLQSEDLKDTLVISYLGYASQEYVLENLDIDQNLAVVLKQDQQSLVEVIIKAKSPISEQFAVTKLDRLQIYTNPIAQGDPLKAITGLAASTNVDESANPALRGSSAGRSLVVFNKVPVRSPVRNSQINGLGFFSLFNPEIIKSQYVYASNPPLTYGNASAGLVEIQTQDELNTSNIQLAASLAGVGIFSSNIINEKSFVQAYGNIQFSKPFIELNRSNLPNLNAFSNKD